MSTTPKYVQDILSRSEYEFDDCTGNKQYAVGYTLRVHKRTTQTLAATLEKEIRQLQAWAQKTYQKRYSGSNEPVAHILRVPTKTHYRDQYAVITIFDPIMKNIEQQIGGN